MYSFENKRISTIVREHYSTADIFKKYGISYCCGGDIDFQTACKLVQIDQEKLLEDLHQAIRPRRISMKTDYQNWSLDFLTDYVVNMHHGYVTLILPELQAGLVSFYEQHRKKFPEMEGTIDLLDQIARSLVSGDLEEEKNIFPYIKQIENARLYEESYGKLLVSTLGKSLNCLWQNAQRELRLLSKLKDHTSNYEVPPNACTKMHVLYEQLKEFHHELVQHKFLEEKIILPRALAIERELLSC